MNKYQVIIIGSGPAGYTAAIYCARACLDVLMISGNQKGGQLTVTTDVENYPGFPSPIQGPWLMEQMELQCKNLGVKIVEEHVISAELSTNPFLITTNRQNTFESESVIIATGAEAKWLDIESEKKFRGYGVSGCATCDAFFYKNKKVAVIGGGNSAMEEALYLTKFASEVILIHRRDEFKAEKMLQKKVMDNSKIKLELNSITEEICGTDKPLSVNGIKIKNIKTGEGKYINLDGVFIAIGHKPNTSIFKELKLDSEGYILTEKGSTKTNISGVFAAGDVQDKIYKQAITAAGTGCMAALDAEKFLNEKVKK